MKKLTKLYLLIICVTVTTSIILAVLCFSTKRVLYETKEELSLVNIELSNTKDTLNETCELLTFFTEPIQYDVAAARIYDIPLSEELQEYTYDMCVAYNIEEYYETVLAIMWQESNYNPDVISVTDDYGLMQINSCNFEYLVDSLNVTNFLEPYDNIKCGIYILSTLVDKYEDIHSAVVAYNLGPSGAESLWSNGIYETSYSRAIEEKTEAILNNKYEK